MKLITFRREITISDLLLLAMVGVVMVSDHVRLGKLEEDKASIMASVSQTNANLASLAESCHQTAGKVEELAMFVHRPGPPPQRMAY